jgi:hypothetical protein
MTNFSSAKSMHPQEYLGGNSRIYLPVSLTSKKLKKRRTASVLSSGSSSDLFFP